MQEIADFCNDVDDVYGQSDNMVGFLSDAVWAIGEFADGTNTNALEEFRAAHPSMRASS